MTRFAVTYRLRAGDAAEARARAEGIALEQTVEIPRDAVPPGYVEDVVLGRVEDVGPLAEGVWQAVVSYAPDSTGTEFTQVLNVVFGNSSIQAGLRVTGIDPGAALSPLLPGPRFGIQGIRALCARPAGALVVPVIKPMGLSPADLAALAADCTRGGADIIKEDHGLAGQPAAPFRPRVEAMAQAIARAREATGHRTLYFANLSGRVQEIEGNLRFLKDAGADGVLVMPGLFGFGLVHRIASDAGLNLPVMTHPSFLGPFVLAPDNGIDHGVLFGTIQRMAGSDISVFPNVGGRFGFTAGECRAIARACRDPAGPGRPILPSPGGGMSAERAPDMAAMYGPDAAFLLGGSLLRARGRVAAEVARMRAALDGSVPGAP